MDPIVLTVIEHSLRAIAAFGPGILAALFDTADDDAALALARERARGAIAKIRATPVDDAVRDAIAAHAALPRFAAGDPKARMLRDMATEDAERAARGDEPTRETKVPT